MSVAIDETAIQEAVRRIVERFDPDEVILFGSRARGDAREDSDYDLLIVGPSAQPRGKRTGDVYGSLLGLGIPIDVLWWTQEETDEWSEVRSHFINRVLADGTYLYTKNLLPTSPASPRKGPLKMPVDHARMFWRKAQNDLLAARAVIATGQAFDTVCFHAQQAAEKSLKAILAMADVTPPRTHELKVLSARAKETVADWPFDDEQIATLTRYAVIIRYEEAPEPTRDEAVTALETAEEVHRLTGGLIGVDALQSDPERPADD